MRVLVTGATGCVGANIVEAFQDRGYRVRAMRRTSSCLDALTGLQPEFVVGDVTDYKSVMSAMEGCQLVVHTAAISQYWRSTPDVIYHVNVMGTRNVLDAAMALGVERVVVTSSVATLGVPVKKGQLITESNEFNLRPEQFHYGHSKFLAEAEIRRAVNKGLDAVIVNPVSVIGQRDVYFVGGEILRMALRGVFLFSPPGGMGVISARTAGLGHVLAAERGHTGERYILNGENISHRALMGQVAEITGARPPLLVIPRTLVKALGGILFQLQRVGIRLTAFNASQVMLSACDLYFDGHKAERDLGLPRVSAGKAVQEAWNWYRAQALL